MGARRIRPPAAIISAMGLLAVLLSMVAATAPTSAATPPSGLGVNAQELLNALPFRDWNVNLAQMHADGVRTVRADAFWDSIEPSAPDASGHHYNFRHTDTIAGALAYFGMRWLPIADYSTPWSASLDTGGRPNLLSPPKNYDDYVSYVKALIARYGPGGTFWAQNPSLTPEPIAAIEVWNEPDGGYFWLPAPQPAAYARLYESTRQAAHAIDPSIKVIIGGLSPWNNFLDGVYAALGGAGKIDAVGVHPYAGESWQVTAGVAKIRAVMDAHGDVNVPIDVTEFGWSTAGAHAITDAQRAQRLTEAATWLASSDCNVERILPHTWASPEANPNNSEDWYGLVSPTGTPHQSATALAQTYHALGRTAATTSRFEHATYPVCGRPLALSLAHSSHAASTSPARHRHRHVRRHGQHRAARGAAVPRCVRALVRSGASPIAGALVSYRVKSGQRVLRGPSPVVTNAGGVATACIKIPAGTRAVVTASAQSPDFVPVPTTSVSI